jgi:hypothetical protein
MENLSFGSIFEDLFINLKLKKEMTFTEKINKMKLTPLKKKKVKKYKLEIENDIGSILNLIATCLEFEPTKRPSLLAIEKSKILDLD